MHEISDNLELGELALPLALALAGLLPNINGPLSDLN